MQKIPFTSLVCCAVLFLCAMPGRAQLQFDLTPAVLTGMPGDTVTFSGTLTNLGGAELFLNGDGIDLAGTGFTDDDTDFVLGAPLSLAPAGTPGDTWSGNLFDVAIASDVPPADYPGEYMITGGDTGTSNDVLTIRDFVVTVTPPSAVPESGASALLLGILLSCIGTRCYSRSRTRQV